MFAVQGEHGLCVSSSASAHGRDICGRSDPHNADAARSGTEDRGSNGQSDDIGHRDRNHSRDCQT
jgi:hypothetical protein